ncbi:ABC transporter permease [Angustibacter aerolatus]
MLASDSLVQLHGDVVSPALVAAVVLCTAVAVAVNALGGLGHAGGVLRAAARAVVQLLVVALVITAVLRHAALALAFVALMTTVAGATAARRLTGGRDGWWALAAVAAAALLVLGLLVGVRLVPGGGTGLVAVAGILIGGAMSATVLAGRRALDALRTRHGEWEAALSIGFRERDAALLVARDDAALALVPGLDQTRTVGLVTLPGAFVGMLLGGASPAEAAVVQLVVLVALLAVQSVAVLLVLELVARGRVRGRSQQP